MKILAEIDWNAIIITALLSFFISMILKDYVITGISYIYSVFKRKIVKDEALIGMYYGYYLNKDANLGIQLKESLFDILPDMKKGGYNVRIYKIDKDKNVRNKEIKLNTISNIGNINAKNRKQILSSKLLKCKYKGKISKEGNHLLFSLGATRHTETIYERRVLVTKPDEYQIVGISLAINSVTKIRANISVLSKKKLDKAGVLEIINKYNGLVEKDTFNLKVNNL